MRIQVASFVLLAAALPSVFGHGQVHSVITSSGTYKAADAYAAVDPTSPLRKLNTYGPPSDFTSPDITCGPGGNVPITPLAEVDAGSVVTFDWGSWTSVHPGPVMTYIAKCPDGCANFKGDTGNVWIKIDQDGYNPSRASDIPWGENIIRLRGNQYKVTVPAGLENGEYILRHEILGLHVAGNLMGAQFYPNCLQIKVVNGGNVQLPTGIPLPGSYDPHDPGILVDLWRITPSSPNYTIPGGPVLLQGGTGDWGNTAYGNGTPTVPPPPPPPPPATSAPASASSPSTAPSSVPSNTGAVVKYGQCGGQNYNGLTACVAGTTCTKMNDFYSQCL